MVAAITCVVLHATADRGNEFGAEQWLCNPRSRVSAHLCIRRDGSVVRLVADCERALHAGVSVWGGRTNVSDYSLGWELANRNDERERYTDAQYASIARLAVHYVRQGLPIDAFVSHADVALPPRRKTDPAAFDWGRFRRGVQDELSTSPR
jgi:N-acetylmuramoyl-L-alanine amidase